MAQPSEYPVVRAAVNQRIADVRARSSYRFDLSGVLDDSPVIVATPVTFVYDGPTGGAFTLPPGRFVSVGQFGGWAYDYTVAPQLSDATLDAAYATAQAVTAAIGQAPGWRRLGAPPPSLAALRGDAAGAEWQAADFGQWRLAGAELGVTLKRGGTTGKYFVEVRIFDGTHNMAYAKRAYAIRRARQHGDAANPLPLTAVLDDPTPVPPPAGAGR